MLDHVDPADPDHGPRTAKPGTERMCVVTRQVRPIDELIRFVVAPDGAAVPDLKRKLPGRGLWVTSGDRTPWLMETGKGTRPLVVHFQMRPDPLAK